MTDRTTDDLERELALLVNVRAYLRDAEGPDFRIPTTTIDEVLDELNSHYRDTDLRHPRFSATRRVSHQPSPND
jgi:hypothetical protein